MAMTQKEKYKMLNLIMKQQYPIFYEFFRDSNGIRLKIGDYVRINTTHNNKYIHQGVYLIDFDFEVGVRFVCQGIFRNEFVQLERIEWKDFSQKGNMFILKNVFTMKDFLGKNDTYFGKIRTTNNDDFVYCSLAKLKNACYKQIIKIWDNGTDTIRNDRAVIAGDNADR